MDINKENTNSESHAFFVQQDKETQVREALYYLQTELDSVKENAAKNVDIAAGLSELKTEVSALTDSCRADLYALNDKLETGNREQSRNFINTIEEFKKYCAEKDARISSFLRSLEQKIEENFGELALRIDKVTTLSEKNKSDEPNALSEMSTKLDCVFDAVAESKTTNSETILSEINSKLNELSSFNKAENANAQGEKDCNFSGIISRLDALEAKLASPEEKEASLFSAIDGVGQTLSSLSAVFEENSTELSAVMKGVEDVKRRVDNIRFNGEVALTSDAPVLLEGTERLEAAITAKLEELSLEMKTLKEAAATSEKKESGLADNDDVMRMLEKISNQICVLMEDNRSKISEIRLELDRFKDNFTTITSGDLTEDGDELKQSFENLTSELDTLSKLVAEKSEETSDIPEAVLSVSDELQTLPLEEGTSAEKI